MIAALKMQTSQERQEYTDAKETLRSARTYVSEHIAAVQAIAQANKTAKRTRQISIEAARTLDWVKRTEAYREEFGPGDQGFARFYRSLKYSPAWVSDLLNFLKISDSVPTEAQQKLGSDGMSFRQARVLATVPQEEREAFIEEAAAAGKTGPKALKGLRDEKQADPVFDRISKAAETAPEPETFDEGETAKKAKAPENALAWAKRQATTWQTWFQARGTGEEAEPIIAQLLELAEACADVKPA